MAHESFEDEETAEFMNKNFINIKVDREERPDIDGIYMQAVIAMTGSGGWPMSVFLAPDLKPFYAGTYFPPVRRYNMPPSKTYFQVWRMHGRMKEVKLKKLEFKLTIIYRIKTKIKKAIFCSLNILKPSQTQWLTLMIGVMAAGVRLQNFLKP
jgi:hypothetical protein